MLDNRTIFDFARADAVQIWQTIDDVVMGGVSHSRVTWVEPAENRCAGNSDAGCLRFEGIVSLANNGGFCSARTTTGDWGLSYYNALKLDVVGDGKTYKFGIYTSQNRDGVVYRQRFETKDRETSRIILPFDGFEARFRGRPVPKAPPMNPDRISGFGLLISDGQEGPFQLDVDTVAAVR